MMRRTLLISLLFSLAPGLALGEEQGLDDQMLDAVTASGAGGVVVVDGSSADITTNTQINLSGNAQQDAAGLNFVNGADSAVATGVNIWDGAVAGEHSLDAKTVFNIRQVNEIDQVDGGAAYVAGFERSGVSTFDQETLEVSRNESSSFDRIDNRNDRDTLNHSNNSTSTASVTTDLSLTGDDLPANASAPLGRGFAGAGDVEIDFLSGEAGPSFELLFEANAAGVTGTDVTLRINQPEITIDAEGALCAVSQGSCNGSGTSTITRNEERDLGTALDEDGMEMLALTQREESHSERRAPVVFESAEGDFIVMDGSHLTSLTESGVILSGSAQQNLRTLNGVNASASTIATSVNISRTGTVNLQSQADSFLNLEQINRVSHRR